MYQLNIDCEGPLTSNDNAYELCDHIIPSGGDFFTRISKYDDYLADIEKRRGYRAGDTLRLVLPFLKAWGATDEMMKRFSARTLLLLPGTEQMLPFASSLMPVFIISTSYRPYLDALCSHTSFPSENVYCTDVNIDNLSPGSREIEKLKTLTEEIVNMPIPAWDSGTASPADLDTDAKKIIKRLEDIFWKEISHMETGQFLRNVKPVGGEEKAIAVKDSLKRTGSSLADVFYAGDSITDVQALKLARENGGLSLSFNGNSYAVRSAEWAAIAGNTALIGAIVHLVAKHGTRCLEKMPADRGGRCQGEKLVTWLNELGADGTMTDMVRTDPDKSGINPAIIHIDSANMDTIIKESEHIRKKVRGLCIGNLG